MSFREYLSKSLKDDEELRDCYYNDLESGCNYADRRITAMLVDEKIELNSHGVNKLIKYNILSDERMMELGFHKNYYEGTDHEKYSPNWYLIRNIDFPRGFKYCNISFNVYIPKDNSDINIMVLDDDFCQHYDYQRILYKNPDNECANIVKKQVEQWMEYLQYNGVISGHKYGEYI